MSLSKIRRDKSASGSVKTDEAITIKTKSCLWKSTVVNLQPNSLPPPLVTLPFSLPLDLLPYNLALSTLSFPLPIMPANIDCFYHQQGYAQQQQPDLVCLPQQSISNIKWCTQ